MVEIHISSIIVYTLPKHTASIAANISKGRDIDLVAQEDAAGKIILIAETASTKEVSVFIDKIKELPNVLSVAMVYHHVEAATSLGEKLL